MPSGSAFLQIWSDAKLRNTFLSFVPKDELASFRLVCKDFAFRTAPALFKEKKVTFRKGLFTSPSWLAMLDRLGHHVKIFHFNMPHSKNTSLPPLIDDYGEAVDFVYDPYTGSTRKQYDFVPPYGSPELYDLLTRHYPTLFHAAANVPSFIRVFASLTNVKHLKVSCPDQDRSEAYMRSAVDYALISLRIAVERNKLVKLNSLSLLTVHPMASFYLNPFSGFGARPNSVKRWRQIRNLVIHMDTPPTCTPADHLKLLHSYLHLFASGLEDFQFRWQGLNAPWPLSLHNEPTPQNQRAATVYAMQTQSHLPPLHMPNLRSSYAENITVDASQISAFVEAHHHMTRRHDRCSMDFQKSHLRSGTWDEALAPFSRISGADKWEKAMDRARKESMEKLKLNNQNYSNEPAKRKSRPTSRRSKPDMALELLKPVCFDPHNAEKAAKDTPTKVLANSSLHRVIGSRTKDLTRELLFSTEGRVRDLFRASIFSCWTGAGSKSSRSPSVASRVGGRSPGSSIAAPPTCRPDEFQALPSTKLDYYNGGRLGTPMQDMYLLPSTRYEGSILGRASLCA